MREAKAYNCLSYGYSPFACTQPLSYTGFAAHPGYATTFMFDIAFEESMPSTGPSDTTLLTNYFFANIFSPSAVK